MRPTFLGFESCRKGLAVAQKGLDITGHNLMNAATPGYTRQRIDQVSVTAYGTQSRYAGNRIDFTGQGVNITGVAQTRDAILDRRFREEFCENYYYQEKVNILSDITSVVDQFATSGGSILDAINDISTALQNLSGDHSTDRSYASNLLTTFKGLVQTLNDASKRLDKVMEQQKADLQVSVDDVNSILSKIAGLNKQITSEIGLNPTDERVYEPNELMDERNLLLDELSKYGDMEIATQEDGSVTVKLGGHTVVKGDKYEVLNYSERTGGTAYLCWQDTGEETQFQSGALRAATDMINGRGPYIQSKYESPEKGVLYYKDRLNTLARTLADVMNNVLPEELDDQGQPVAGSGYKELLSSSQVDENGNTLEITAGNIMISDAWNADSTYVLPSKTSLNNSKYFQEMKTLLTSNKTTVFDTYGQTFTGSFEDYILDISVTAAGEESFNQGRLTAVGAIADQLLNERDSVMGVNSDEETANMMTYQKSFQAVSRMITTMDDVLDVIINQMGRVGR